MASPGPEGEVATKLIPTSEVQKAVDARPGGQVRRLLYEAPPLQPADCEAEARERPVCLWLQVFSLQT